MANEPTQIQKLRKNTKILWGKTQLFTRKQAQITGQAQAAAQARSDQSAAISSTVSAVGNVAGSFMSAKAIQDS